MQRRAKDNEVWNKTSVELPELWQEEVLICKVDLTNRL